VRSDPRTTRKKPNLLCPHPHASFHGQILAGKILYPISLHKSHGLNPETIHTFCPTIVRNVSSIRHLVLNVREKNTEIKLNSHKLGKFLWKYLYNSSLTGNSNSSHDIMQPNPAGYNLKIRIYSRGGIMKSTPSPKCLG